MAQFVGGPLKTGKIISAQGSLREGGDAALFSAWPGIGLRTN